jgi:GT2 family glycosyltransferase
MVAHDPGPWWEDACGASALTYPSIATFVIDTASATDLTPRVARCCRGPPPPPRPRPRLRPAANEAIEAIEGAAFFLLCHDDVVLDPGAVQAMVEEAFRSNAGIVGPKIVDWNDPDVLVQVGMGADKFGVPSPLVDRGELDQEQHDAVRDVFFVPGGAMLVRADLFETLRGLDPAIDFLGEDLDLCWRAHTVGARVLVAPGARVAHREALDERRDTADRRRLTYEHRLRTMLTNYGRFHRLRVVPQALVLAVVEAISSLVLGRVRHARDVVGAWTTNLGQLGDIRARRKQVAAARIVKDAEVRGLQVRGSASVSAFFRGQFGANDDRLAGMAGAGRDLANSLRAPTARLSLAAWIVVLLVLVVGSRDLLTAPIPAIGELVPFSSSPSTCSGSGSAYHSAGLGSDAAGRPLRVPGTAGLVFFGAMGQLRRVWCSACCRSGCSACGGWPAPSDPVGPGSWRCAHAAVPWREQHRRCPLERTGAPRSRPGS